MSAPRAALAVISALLALAPLPTISTGDLDSYYSTIVQKGKPLSHLEESVGPLYIPENQCSGVLDSMLRCDDGSEVRAVRVRLYDNAFGQLTLDNNLRSSTVLRSDCSDEAIVFLELDCNNS